MPLSGKIYISYQMEL
nr:unnamed protein product [Callosobruchus analis]CAI5865341.1 unnamed protein product [Callosobruchus analis]